MAFTVDGFHLYRRKIHLSDGSQREHYFFTRHAVDNAEAVEYVPAGYRVGKNRRNGMPYLKKVPGAGKDAGPKTRKSPRKAPKKKEGKKTPAKRKKASKKKAAKRKAPKKKAAKRKAPKKKAAKRKAPKKKAAKKKASRKKASRKRK